MGDDNVIEVENIKDEQEKPEENWLDRLCKWGHDHPVAIALIVILCPFGLIWLGTLIGKPSIEDDDTEYEVLDTDGLKPIPVETVETTRYKWVEDSDSDK